MRKLTFMAGLAALAACLAAGALPAAAATAPAPDPVVTLEAAPAAEAAVAVEAPIQTLATSTQTFSGSFKASLRSKSFSQYSDNSIRAKVTTTGCSAAYPNIKVSLYNVTVLTNSWQVGATQTVPCGTAWWVTWQQPGRGAFQLQFDRTGPAGKDEGTKSVSGLIAFTP